MPARSDPGEEPVLLPESDGPDDVLHRVVVDRQVPGGGIATQGRPAFQAVVDGLRRAAAIGHRHAGLEQPVVHRREAAAARVPAAMRARFHGHVPALCLDGIQRRDPAQRLLRDRIRLRLIQIEELPARVRQATQFRHPLSEQRLVPGEIIDHEMALPPGEEVPGHGAPRDWSGNRTPRSAVPFPARCCDRPTDRPVWSCLGPGPAVHRRFIGMQHVAFQQQLGQAIRQRLQRHADAPHPFRHRGAGQDDPIPCRDLLQPVQRQVIQVFADEHPDVQAHGRHAAVDHGRRDRRRRHRLAGTAGVLRTDVTMDEESGRFDIELFADVFTDLDQIAAALAAGAGFRFVMVLDARQMIGQRLAAGTRTRWRRRRGVGRGAASACFLASSASAAANVAGQGFLEQVALFTAEGFAPGAKAHPAQVGQFEDEGLDLGLGGVKVGVAASDLPPAMTSAASSCA